MKLKMIDILSIMGKSVCSQRHILHVTVCVCLTLALFNRCAQTPSVKQQAVAKAFTLPEIPIVLTTNEQRAEYLVLHYWDNCGFADTTLINNDKITEQLFADFLSLFDHTPLSVVERGINTMLNKALDGDIKTYDHFTALYEKYLYDPNSPLRNEDYYIAVLKAIISNEQIDELSKVRPRYQLAMALKNRPSEKATDFWYTTANGGTSKMSKISAEYLIIFFNNPDCHDCARVKQILSKISDKRVRVLAIYADDDVEKWRKAEYPSNWINGRSHQLRAEELYDLKAIPTLYLLDKNKQVILKDATVELIEQYFKTNHNQI